MKIFYWLHKRIYTNGEYCRVPRHSKDLSMEDGSSADVSMKVGQAGTEMEALLFDPGVMSLQDVLDGILTIGTLGNFEIGRCHHQLALVPAADAAAFASGVSVFGIEPDGVAVELAPPAEQPSRGVAAESFRKEAAPVGDNVKSINLVKGTGVDEEEGDFEPLLGEITEVDKKERVTLADLLAAEHMSEEKSSTTSRAAPASAKTALEKAANPASKVTLIPAPVMDSTKHGLPLNQKPVASKKGKEHLPQAAGKLHQRIRRMLKKKIHPEMAHEMRHTEASRAASVTSPMGPYASTDRAPEGVHAADRDVQLRRRVPA